MTLAVVVMEYEQAKQRIIPKLAEKRYVIPIFRLEADKKGLLAGNGFFLNSNGDLDYQHTTNGFSEPATPLNLYHAFRMFYENVSVREALERATKALNEAPSKFNL